MGLKKFDSGITTVRLPAEIRLALKEKGWTILQAIKNSLIYRNQTSYEGEICKRPECVRAKQRLIELIRNGDE